MQQPKKCGHCSTLRREFCVCVCVCGVVFFSWVGDGVCDIFTLWTGLCTISTDDVCLPGPDDGNARIC